MTQEEQKMANTEIQNVRQQIAQMERQLELLKAREWALSVAQNRTRDQILALISDRRSGAQECLERAQTFSQNLRGGDKKMVKGSWNHNAVVNNDYADALEAILA
jgi:vacuolar-type H+-ATPase subunit E/Vma4